jgi:signal transduction histidine kinase
MKRNNHEPELLDRQQSVNRASDTRKARQELESAATLHWFHWLIVTLSLLLTFFAWCYSKSELEARGKVQFDREAEQAVELVQERMRKYENALWGGVALMDASDSDVDFDHWKAYADSFNIEQKYPGINGIGVIHALQPEEFPDYLTSQRNRRPDYNVHPPHSESECYPVSYIIPVQGNEKAVGLDMAHETNRFTAAKKSRDTGDAQITGPITLVQDSGGTPGFLFCAPFYQGGTPANKRELKAQFSGMVYAPFVVWKLMEGVLEKEKRHVVIRLLDGDDVMYDEHLSSEADFDPDPLFKRSITASCYGRTWTFDIWSAKSFREVSLVSQPMIILVGGIFIDAMLILLFVSISRASHKALRYADSMTNQLEATAKELKANQHDLAARARELEDSNAELEQFAYVASHDLQEPMRKISSCCQILLEDYGDKFDDEGKEWVGFAVDSAHQMRNLIRDLLAFSRVDRTDTDVCQVDAKSICLMAIEKLQGSIDDANAQVACHELPKVGANQTRLGQLFQNLIGNGIKYRGSRFPVIEVGSESAGDFWRFYVRDNGIGIEPKYADKIFAIFQRLHGKEEFSGTGIGLAICKKIVERAGGKIWFDSTPGDGSTFYFTWPKENVAEDEQQHEREPALSVH